MSSPQTGREGKSASSGTAEREGLLYGLDSTPPWYLCVTFGFQHYLTMFGSTLAIPLIVTPVLCVYDNVAKAEIIGTIFFVSGIVTFFQTTVGIRLPIVQGGTFSFVGPVFALMSLPKWQCPLQADVSNISMALNSTTETPVDYSEIWKPRMREVQGAIIVSSFFQIFMGLSGLLGFALRFIGPLTISPTITLIGLALFEPAANFCSRQWGIAMLTIILITVFSQYLRKVHVPICVFQQNKKKCSKSTSPIFQLFPIILAIVTAWVFCAVLTASGALPQDPDSIGYGARTDIKTDVLQDAKWFRFPYPGQWGVPTVSAAGVLGMLAGVLAGMLESVGDYYACARMSGAPPPPVHAVNRGMLVEGIGCMLAGLWGFGSGTTSYSENIGAIGITKVASRRVIQAGGLLMIMLGMLGKIGALFVTIPDCIIGGVFMIMFGMITAVGISNLQYVDLNSTRNLFVFGFSTFFGFTLSFWISRHPGIINTGVSEVDQIITVLLQTSMFVGGVIALFLDNTLPGTDEERGMLEWTAHTADIDLETNKAKSQVSIHTYDIPLVMGWLQRHSWTSYIPVSPTFAGWRRRQAPPSEVTCEDSVDVKMRLRPNINIVTDL